MDNERIVVVRGGGDIATGIACRLFNSGFKVVIFETNQPSVIRRKVAFAQAVYENEVTVQGIKGKLVNIWDEALKTAQQDVIPVLVDDKMIYIADNKPYVLVDSILAKKNIGTTKDMAQFVIGVGPGFTAGVDVDAVVETQRGHYLGEVILNGTSIPNTGVPGSIGGYSVERVIKSPCEGRVKILRDIGSFVESGDTVALVDGIEVKTQIGGIVRGMIQDGYYVYNNMKMGDVDPRGIARYCYEISDKARAISGGVLEAILYLTNKGAKRLCG